MIKYIERKAFQSYLYNSMNKRVKISDVHEYSILNIELIDLKKSDFFLRVLIYCIENKIYIY
jgi:hypothetical protein